ncbi:MAG: hypothetical protein ACRDMI_07440, partial [Streptosporangiaceae bacterium]
MKRTGEDGTSKVRRSWKRGRDQPPQNGDGSPPAAKPKRSSRSVFGPSGDDRPDVLTDAETVVLPLWLHRRASSADGKSAANVASFLKNTPVPAQEDEATRPAPGTDTEAAPDAEAAPDTGKPAGTEAAPESGTEAASGAGDVGAEAASPGPDGEVGTDHTEAGAGAAPLEDAGPGEAAEATVAEADAETVVQTDTPTATKVGAETVVGADAATAIKA